MVLDLKNRHEKTPHRWFTHQPLIKNKGYQGYIWTKRVDKVTK